MYVLYRNITMFERANKPYSSKEVNLFKVLTTDKYKPLADTCGSIMDKKQRQAFKLREVPVITVSAICEGGRKEENVKEHTGLLCIDLDGVQDIDTLKGKVSKLPYVAYVGKSISGTGLFAIIPIPKSSPEEHTQRYAALESEFIKLFGITGTIDPQPKNITACRYVSYDPDAYINNNACPFGLLAENVAKPKPTRHYSRGHEKATFGHVAITDHEKVWQIVDKVQTRQIDFCPEYDDYLRIAFSIANGLGEDGRDAYHAVCQFSTKYNYSDADKKYTEALRRGSKVTLGTFFMYAKDMGLTPQTRKVPIYKVPKKKEPDYPKWFVDAMGILQRYEAREITGDQYLDAMQENMEGSGLTPEEYVRQTNELDVMKA